MAVEIIVGFFFTDHTLCDLRRHLSFFYLLVLQFITIIWHFICVTVISHMIFWDYPWKDVLVLVPYHLTLRAT